jgi:hypothetical protein
MSQNDLVIDNQSFPATRADINSALQALGSLNSGSSAPSTTYANMLWYDTTNNTLKMRAEANDAWISVGYLDQGADRFRIFDDTQVVNSSGTQTGLIGDQATSAWEAGTSTTESLVSPAKVAAAIAALASSVPADGSITEVKLASSAVTQSKLKTAQNSVSFSFGENGGSINVTVNEFTFWPKLSTTSASCSVNTTGFRVSASSQASGSVTWRYIDT